MSSAPQSCSAASRLAIVLADPRRYGILKQIARHRAPLAFSALREAHGIGAPTLSYHLRLLAEAGLIDVEKLGRRTIVVLRREVLHAYLQDIRSELELS